MKTIIQVVMEKTGLGEEQAKGAVQAVAGYLKENLPAPVAGQIDGLLGTDVGGYADQADSLLGGLGGMFGKKEG